MIGKGTKKMNNYKDEKQPEGNYYNKYESKNIVERLLMKCFFGNIEKCLRKSDIQPLSILEAGCGEGHFTNFLRNVYTTSEIDAFDVSEKVVKQAKSTLDNINFKVGSIYSIDASEGQYDLVVASEVLEHLETPEKAFGELMRVSSAFVLITVPHEPIWRILNMCRGKYLRRLGNTPGHIQHWSRGAIKKYIRSLSTKNVKRVTIRTSLPWLIIIIEKTNKS